MKKLSFYVKLWKLVIQGNKIRMYIHIILKKKIQKFMVLKKVMACYIFIHASFYKDILYKNI